MARPRIFVSSTYYDLKHVRSSLEKFISSLGYEPVLSEKGEVPSVPGLRPDESCCREVQECDIYVLIIGRRYGSEPVSEATSGPSSERRSSDEKRESVTKREYKRAIKNYIPGYVLIERDVHAEFETYRSSSCKHEFECTHVDSISVFEFIEEIFADGMYWIRSFDQFGDIEAFLQKQWAGLFKHLLREQAKQRETEAVNQVRHNPLVDHLITTYGLDFDLIFKQLREATTYQSFIGSFERLPDIEKHHLLHHPTVFRHGNRARAILDLEPWPDKQ